jgi:Helix-turn-helix domain
MTCLKTPEQAADFLQCSPKQVHAHAKSGELRYVDIGRGSKRPRRRFMDTDLIDFAERRTRREAPTCLSTNLKAHRITTSTSKCEVVDFSALRSAVIAGKQKR